LALASEEEADEILAAELVDGVELQIAVQSPEVARRYDCLIACGTDQRGGETAIEEEEGGDSPEAAALPAPRGLVDAGEEFCASTTHDDTRPDAEPQLPQPRFTDTCDYISGTIGLALSPLNDPATERQVYIAKAGHNLPADPANSNEDVGGESSLPSQSGFQTISASDLAEARADAPTRAELPQPRFVSTGSDDDSEASSPELLPQTRFATADDDVHADGGGAASSASSPPRPNLAVLGDCSCEKTIAEQLPCPRFAAGSDKEDNDQLQGGAKASLPEVLLAERGVLANAHSVRAPLAAKGRAGNAGGPEVRLMSTTAVVPAARGGSTASGAAEGSGGVSALVVPCKVRELRDWLMEMNLLEYHAQASSWCVEMGAAMLEEIAENIEDFGAAVVLKPIERQRVAKWAAQVLYQPPPAIGADAVVDWRPAPQALPWQPPGGGDGSEWGHAHEAVLWQPGDGGGEWGQRHRVLWHESSGEWNAESRDRLAEVAAPPMEEGAGRCTIYTARSVRLAMDSEGVTGLELRWDEECGIIVRSVDPLPGQPGLHAGDCIVAINGHSLRHRSHEECEAIFAEHLEDGVTLNVATPTVVDQGPSSRQLPQPSGVGGVAPQRLRPRLPGTGLRGAKGHSKGASGGGVAPRLSHEAYSFGSRGRRGGYDANRMWTRFRGPPW